MLTWRCCCMGSVAVWLPVVNQPMDPFLLPTGRPCTVAPPQKTAPVLICDLPGRLQQRWQSLSDQTFPPAEAWQVGWVSVHVCCLRCVYSEETLSSYESGNFCTHQFLIMLLSSYQTRPWLNFHSLWYKCLPTSTGASPDLMAFDKKNSSLRLLQCPSTK